MDAPVETRAPKDELTLRELLTTLWAGRWFISTVTIAVTIGATAAAVLLPKSYGATVVLSPVRSVSVERAGSDCIEDCDESSEREARGSLGVKCDPTRVRA